MVLSKNLNKEFFIDGWMFKDKEGE